MTRHKKRKVAANKPSKVKRTQTQPKNSGAVTKIGRAKKCTTHSDKQVCSHGMPKYRVDHV